MNPSLNPATTAVILIGYQNDYFSPEGALFDVVKDSALKVLRNTMAILESLEDTPAMLISTPILFTPDYSELVEPIGILKTIKDSRAFRAHTPGSQPIAPIQAYGSRILEVPGKRGLNAFSNTRLGELLRQQRITDVVLVGVVTSLCIESTGREAFEQGYRVIVISDATAGKSDFEQDYYCKEIFPMYATVMNHQTLLEQLGRG
ncbi:MAG: cysteine hydrolase family protein [Methylococcus sp.]